MSDRRLPRMARRRCRDWRSCWNVEELAGVPWPVYEPVQPIMTRLEGLEWQLHQSRQRVCVALALLAARVALRVLQTMLSGCTGFIFRRAP